MPAAILDGQARFGVSLEAFYRRPELVAQVARRGVLIPPTADVDRAAAPALAHVNPLPDGSVRWIAECPDCRAQGRTSAEYVWLATPLLFCTRCGNRDVGGRWRPVAVPVERAEIERLLLARPDPETRAWVPGETVAALAAENAALGVA
jgi:hypothetical protein